MNAKKLAVAPAVSSPLPELSSDDVHEVLFPELSSDTFKLGEKEFSIRVLPWRWEISFRRQAVPMIAEEFKPFEKAAYLFANDMHIVQGNFGLVDAISASEPVADSYLSNAVIVICMSQDPEVQDAAAQGRELDAAKQNVIERKYRVMVENLALPDGNTRTYLREIVRKQSDKLKLVQSLGESLMGRFAELSDLLGQRKTYDSRKQDFSLRVRKFMEKAGSIVGMPDSSSLPSMVNTLETNKPEKLPKKNETETETSTNSEAPTEADQVEDTPEVSTSAK